MALRDELWAVSGEPHLEVEFDDSHPLAQGCISYGVLINGRPYDVKNRVRLQPAGTTGIAATQQGLAATTSSGAGDQWVARFPQYAMTGRNKGSVWGLFYSTVSNNTQKRAIRVAGPVSGIVLGIELGDSANNYLAGLCGVAGAVYPRRHDTAAPAANVLHNVLFTRNSTTQGLYRNGVEVGDANPTTSTANFIDNIDQICIGSNGSALPLQGGVIAWGVWDHDLSVADATLLYQNPRLLLRQRVEVPGAAGGSVSLIVADATHGHTADGLVLTSSTALAVAEATHSHAADSLTLTTDSALAVADATHAHAADSVTLSAASALAVADATHSHAADNITLSVAGTTNLTVADALHSHAADALALTSAHALIVADATHSHAVDGLTLTAASVLAIQDALHAHAADNITLDASGAVNLLLADGLHAHTADGVALTVAAWLTVADALHGHAADNVVLTFAGPTVLSAPPIGHGPAATRRTTSAGRSRAAQLSTRTR